MCRVQMHVDQHSCEFKCLVQDSLLGILAISGKYMMVKLINNWVYVGERYQQWQQKMSTLTIRWGKKLGRESKQLYYCTIHSLITLISTLYDNNTRASIVLKIVIEYTVEPAAYEHNERRQGTLSDRLCNKDESMQ